MLSWRVPKRRKQRNAGQAWRGALGLLLIAGAAGAGWWYLPREGWPAWSRTGFWRTNDWPSDIFEPVDLPESSPTNSPPAVARPLPPQPPVKTNPPAASPPPARGAPRPPKDTLEAQIGLARAGISVGCLDGAASENMRRALLAFQIHNDLPVSGALDEETRRAIRVEDPLLATYEVTKADLDRLMDVPDTWLGKSQVKRLDYETALELVAEKGRSTTGLIKALNPNVDWANVRPGTPVKIPQIDPPPVREKAAFIRVHLYSKTLDVFGRATNLLAHYPCSIAAKVEKRPLGTLYVARAAGDPSYVFNPEIFPESAEAKKIGRKLVLPPGPNNPVGAAWIGLDKPGYGIHGTPKPEQIGRTESHGCFRLANWNASHLLELAWVGMPVIVEP
jgi:lipoprotein-anchoring transpeptidase ErfK/SrfK